MRIEILVLFAFAAAAIYFASQGDMLGFGICFVLWAIAALIKLFGSRSGDKNDRDQK